jgi:hypothetical protein
LQVVIAAIDSAMRDSAGERIGMETSGLGPSDHLATHD